MCAPAIFAAVSIAATIAGTVTQAVAARSAADSAQKTARYNAELRERQARDAIERARIRKHNRDAKTLKNLGIQRAEIAAAGIALSEGNALDIQLQEIQFGAEDAAMEMYAGILEATAFRNDAQLQLFKGDVVAANAKGQIVAAVFSGVAGVVGAAGTFAQPGAFEFNNPFGGGVPADPVPPSYYDINFSG